MITHTIFCDLLTGGGMGGVAGGLKLNGNTTPHSCSGPSFAPQMSPITNVHTWRGSPSILFSVVIKCFSLFQKKKTLDWSDMGAYLSRIHPKVSEEVSQLIL